MTDVYTPNRIFKIEKKKKRTQPSIVKDTESSISLLSSHKINERVCPIEKGVQSNVIHNRRETAQISINRPANEQTIVR